MHFKKPGPLGLLTTRLMILHNVSNSQCYQRERQIDLLFVARLIAPNRVISVQVLSNKLVLNARREISGPSHTNINVRTWKTQLPAALERL